MELLSHLHNYRIRVQFVFFSDCTMHLLRQLLICTNCLLLTLTAIFVSIVGFLIFSSREELDWIASPSTQNYLVYILVGFILLVVLTAFFGFVGSLKSSKQCMFLYISFLAMAITFELATGAVLFRYYTKGELRNVGEELMFQSMEKYTKDKTVRTLWDGYQSKMECCGVTGFMNWWKYTVKPPMSCCRKHSEFGEVTSNFVIIVYLLLQSRALDFFLL